MTKRELLNFNRELRQQGKKCCTTCNEVKPLKEFVTGGKLKSGEMNYKICFICNRKRGIIYKNENPDVEKQWREDNRERLLEKSKKYYQDNKEKYAKFNKKYREENLEHLLEYNRLYQRSNRKTINKNYHERLQTDKLFQIKESIRKTVYHTIRSPKKFLTCDILGCSYEVFKVHIENQFQEGMKWDNHGISGWHYDHIIPVSSAKTEEELYKLNHYTNFQPLWWYDNLSKSNKLGWSKELQINN